jgi:hypothetical protein
VKRPADLPQVVKADDALRFRFVAAENRKNQGKDQAQREQAEQQVSTAERAKVAFHNVPLSPTRADRSPRPLKKSPILAFHN